MSPDVNDPGFRNVTFDDLVAAYCEATDGLIEGGADLLMIETSFDTLNAKAAIYAIFRTFEEKGVRLPIMVSGTITDASGRTLSGQTPEAFWNSVAPRPAALGRAQLRARRQGAASPHPGDLARRRHPCLRSIPTPACPTPSAATTRRRRTWRRCWANSRGSGFVNIVGGCCGTTPEHIRAIAEAVAGVAPRKTPAADPPVPPVGARAAHHRRRGKDGGGGFVNVGERTNVTGSTASPG